MNFVEIGSNDYDTMVHSRFFCEQSWGIVVEPVKTFFDRIPRYANVTYLNSAVTPAHDGRIKFYAPVDDPDPPWVKSVGSVNPHHPTLQQLGIENQTHEIEVDAISLKTLYSHFPDDKIHVLKLDTEGSDYGLLTAWAFDQYLPMQIQFESKLMSATQLDTIRMLLTQYGYSVTAGHKKDYNATPYNHLAILEI